MRLTDATVRRTTSPQKPTNKHKVKGGKGKGGGKGLPLHYLQPRVATAQQQPQLASLLASPVSPSHQQSTLSHAGTGKGKGKDGKGKGP